MKPSLLKKHRLAVVPLLLSAPLAFAASISGTVTNRTTNKPAPGDTVTLIKLAQGMQEDGATKTDARGRYTLNVPDEGIHLVRVTHDKANYFQPVEPSATSADIDVFSAAPKVDGVTTEAEVLHVQSGAGGNTLDVVASFFVKNVSSPPRTQFSDRPFDFYLPAGAIIESSVALGPGKISMPVKSPPVPLGDTPDHYAFIFPLRPCAGDAAADSACGETRFQVTFKVPYTGTLALAPRVPTLVDTLAVMLPKSMSFKAVSGTTYIAATDETTAQAWVARNVQPGQPLGFTVSGSGQLPRDSQPNGQPGSTQADASGPQPGADASDLTPSQASARQRADSKPGVGLNNPLDSDGDLEPWAKYKWWILGILGLALAGGAGFMLKAAPAPVSAPPANPNLLPNNDPASASAPLLQTLKDELFALETDRLTGQLTEPEYLAHKQALELILRRALTRTGSPAPTSVA